MFEDGKAHTIAEIENALQAQGFDPKNLSVQLAGMTRTSKLQRKGRGLYAKAE